MLRAFFDSLAEQANETDKQFVFSKSTQISNDLLILSDHFKDAPPFLVCLIRDPRAVVSSVLGGQSLVNMPISQICESWWNNFKVINRLKETYPVYVMKYEDLCLNTEGELRKFCQFLNVEFDEIMLKTTLMGEKFKGNSSFGLLGDDVSKEQVDKWKDKLTRAQVRETETRLGPLLKEAGYENVCESAILRITNKIQRATLAARATSGNLLQSLGGVSFAKGSMIGLVVGASLVFLLSG